MAATLLATQVPAPQVASNFVILDDAENTTGADGAVVLRTYAQGQSIISTSLNRNAAAQELLGRYGGGARGVARGLALSIPGGGGLSMPVSAGHAVNDGVVEIPANTTITPASGASNVRCHIWLHQDGTLESVETSLTPPTGQPVYLGSCMVSTLGPSIASVDTSGVMYLSGGIPWRETADVGMPLDTPSSSIIFLHKTTTGWYLWTGTYYATLGPLPASLKTVLTPENMLLGLTTGPGSADCGVVDIGGNKTKIGGCMVWLEPGLYTGWEYKHWGGAAASTDYHYNVNILAPRSTSGAGRWLPGTAVDAAACGVGLMTAGASWGTPNYADFGGSGVRISKAGVYFVCIQLHYSFTSATIYGVGADNNRIVAAGGVYPNFLTNETFSWSSGTFPSLAAATFTYGQGTHGQWTPSLTRVQL